MSATDTPGDSAAFCADLVRGHDFARYASTLFVPAAERRALLALYAFNVEIFRVRYQVTQSLPGEIRFQWWTDTLAGQGHGGVEGNPVAAELASAIRNFHLPAAPLVRLIEEHQFDLYNDPMPNMAALESYLTATYSALFTLAAKIAAKIAAPPSEAIDHLSHHAGLAQGLAQVIANLPRDASRQQLFVPQELLERHGTGQEQVFAGKQTPALRAAFADLVGEAERHLATALSLLGEVPAEVRPVFLPLALVRRDLARLSRADTDPFVPQSTSRLRTLWTLWRASRSKEFVR